MDSEIKIDVNRADLKRLAAVAESLEVEPIDMARAILLGGISNAEILANEIDEARFDRATEPLRLAAKKYKGKSFEDLAAAGHKKRPRKS